MEPFELRLTLLTPMVVPFFTPLDGVLAFAAHQLTGLTGEALMPHIPIKQRDDGIFHASSARAVRARGGKCSMLGRLNERDLDADRLKMGRAKTVQSVNGDFATRLHHYPVCDAHEIRFTAVGDTEGVLRLLEWVPGLGKRARQGMGQIGECRIVPLNGDTSLIGSDGKPARPLPVGVYQALAGREDVPPGVQPFGLKPSYWEGEKPDCVMPDPFW